MLAIFKREFRAYFTGGIGWVFCAVFALVMNFFYYLNCIEYYKTNFIPLFTWMLMLLTFLVPLMTMRIWSEEKKQKIDQLLLTVPISTMEIVLGKFFAALCVFLVALSTTLLFPLFTLIFGTEGSFQPGIIIGNYVAMILAASAYIAIAQFMSSLTESQIVSAILSMFSLSIFLLLNVVFTFTESDFMAKIVEFFSIMTRFVTYLHGIFSVSDAIFYISLTALFLFFTGQVIEKRRWN